MSQRIVFNQTSGTMNQGFHDGLLDIFLALGILFATVAISAGLFWLVAILPVVFSLIWGTARQSITAPRLSGSVPDNTRASKSRLVFGLLSILGVVSFALGVVMFWMFVTDNTPIGLREWIRQNFVLVCWVFGGLILGLTALLARLPRFYFYALLAFVAGTAGPLLGLQPVTYVISLAALMLVVGLVTLLRFFRTHPR